MNRFFLYLDRDTWVHRLDPRAKVLSLLAIFAVALFFSDPRYLMIPLVLILLAATWARAWGNIKRMGLLLGSLFVYCLLLWPLFVEGRTPWLSVSGLEVTREGLQFGLGMGLRLNIMLIAGLVLLSTTTIEEFTLGLQHLGLPSTMGFALALAFRWVPSLIGSTGQIVQAQRSRGLDLAAGSFLARIRRYLPLIVPLIGHTLRQTRLLAMALESKGYGPAIRRQPYVELCLRGPDVLAMAVMLAILVLTLWLRLEGHGTVEVQF